MSAPAVFLGWTPVKNVEAARAWSPGPSPSAPPLLKRQAVDDLQDERRETVLPLRQPPGDLLHHGTVVALQAAPQSIREHLFGQTLAEGLPVGLQDGLQLGGGAEPLPARQRSRRVDAELALARAPGSDRVVVLEPEAEDVHPAVARGAGGIGAMLLQL